MNRKLIAAAAVVAVAAAPQVASAREILVSALALQTCVVIAEPMSFGDVRPGVEVAEASSDLTLTCTPNSRFDVLLNYGRNAEGSKRRMKGGLSGAEEFIPYNLYLDQNHTSAWGNTVGTDTKEGTVGLLGTATMTVYGKVPLTATPVSAGLYTDQVTVTVAF